jgi:N-acetylmuramoyl-L-alanine amidase CwlA
MAVVIKQSLVQPKNYKLKCPYSMTPEYITIHNTANDASAANEIQYMVNSPREVSYHFAVDDKEVIQGIPVDRNAWHCGDGGKGTGNLKSIGIEICYSKSGGTRYYQAEGLAIQLVAQLLKERGWGIDRVKKHKDWSGKHCPHRILDEGRWESFLKAIETELNQVKVASVSPYKETAVIRYIETGGYAGQALLDVHTHLSTIGYSFKAKSNADLSLSFLIGPFDVGTKSYAECKYYFDQNKHANKLLTREEAVEWK